MKNIPYAKQHIDKKDIDSVIKTLKSDFITQGPKIRDFEKAFSDYIGVKHAVAVNNGTSALHAAVLSLGLKPGDRVITTPITFAASANCVRYVGGEVWFADIDPNTYLISLSKVKELIENYPKGFFKGIIVVDFAGLPVNLEEFRLLANKHNLWIIEDACHAPGAYFIDSNGNKQKSGNSKYADIGIFSFHPVKHIACGEGGMITTNSDFIYDKLNLLRTHGISKKNIRNSDGFWYYEMKSLGYNFRLTDIQSALGISQLSKNDNGLKKRNHIAIKYKSAFKDLIKFQHLPKNSFNAHHLFVIEIDKRKKLYDYLRKYNIYAQIHYIPIHTFPYYKKIGYKDADLSSSEHYYSRCISLPMYPTLSNSDQKFVIDKVLDFVKD